LLGATRLLPRNRTGGAAGTRDLLAARDQDRPRVQLLAKPEAGFDQLGFGTELAAPRLRRLGGIGRDDTDSRIAEEILLLGIHGARHAPTLERREELRQERGGDDGFAVVTHEHRVGAVERLLHPLPERRFRCYLERVPCLLVGAEHLLLVRDDARLERGAAGRIADQARCIDAA
jgi:hypothetical protein